jgi:hypothetical protein
MQLSITGMRRCTRRRVRDIENKRTQLEEKERVLTAVMEALKRYSLAAPRSATSLCFMDLVGNDTDPSRVLCFPSVTMHCFVSIPRYRSICFNPLGYGHYLHFCSTVRALRSDTDSYGDSPQKSPQWFLLRGYPSPSGRDHRPRRDHRCLTHSSSRAVARPYGLATCSSNG